MPARCGATGPISVPGVHIFFYQEGSLLDAMQLEITKPLRTDPEKRARLIEVLAFGFGNLVNRYADSHTLTTASVSHFGALGF